MEDCTHKTILGRRRRAEFCPNGSFDITSLKYILQHIKNLRGNGIKLISIAAAAFSALSIASAANAGSITTSQFTFSYDDTFWGLSSGTTVSSTGNTVTFSNLDLSASVAQGGKNSYSYAGYWFGAGTPSSRPFVFSFTANQGYQIDSLSLGATGSVSVASGALGSGADADTSDKTDVNWNAYSSSSVTSGTFENFAAVRDSYSGGSPLNPLGQVKPNGTYSNTSSPIQFGTGFGKIEGSYTVDGYAEAYRKDASASLSRDTASFTIQVSAVPEPETYGMLLAGLGLIGTIIRRKSRST